MPPPRQTMVNGTRVMISWMCSSSYSPGDPESEC